jgi:hypothetical protein
MSADAWVPLAPAGDGPSARSGHVASWIDGLGLVVFGGTGDGRVLGDLWAYDPEADAWRTVDVEGAAPDARTGACAGLGPDGRWWLVGGQDASGARLADLWALDPGGARWTPVPVDGDRPSGRAGATCWWTGDGRLVVSGGMTDDETVVGDRWLLEGVSEGRPRWTRDAVEAVPRALSAAALSASDMVISGGVGPDGAPSDDLVAVDARTLASRAIPPAGAHPSARSGAASVDDPGGERTLLFGGVDEVGPSAEVWALALP